MNVPERIEKLRALMAEKKMDAYIIPSADNHQSEYVGAHFKARGFITGFTGSAGTAIITKDQAGLWTDGRYFLQAEQQLAGSGVKLFKMGEPGVPTTEEFLMTTLPENGTLGFDGRLIAMQEGQAFEEELSSKHVSINYEYDLIDMIWEDRPALSTEPAFFLEEKYSGESTASKLSRVREAMKEVNANAHVITSLDDLCWLLNIRGNDVAFSPLVLGYAIVYMDGVDLFVDKNKLDDTIRAEFTTNKVTVYPYNDIYEAVKKFGASDTLLIDPARMNYAMYNNISSDATKVEKLNPSVLMKAMKNKVELKNIQKAHIKDGVAHTKFIYWLKQNVGKIEITEMSASDKLEEFRGEQEGFLWPSFAPICAFKEHAAIVHYESEPETNVALEPGGLFLSDTGANYYEGSTDITRTIVLGEVSEEEKIHFTTVARSNLSLARAHFLYGTCGYNLDILARQPFWDMNLNFNHGTGHGIGYLLNIHEGPTGFRWQVRAHEAHPFEEGMVITDEPGIYIADSHGVRTENELIVRKGEANEYGQFMYFEPITFVPIDLDAIIPELMSPVEKAELNKYHEQVYANIAPHLTEEERAWLKVNTRAI
ncbi:MAG: aminopeptidase P family protein [Lachnospiraceae bacterium]